MTRFHRGVVLATAFSAAACTSPTDPPPANDPEQPTVLEISLESPLGPKMAIGRSVQLVANVTDPSGVGVKATLTWSSADPSVASVDTVGVISGLAEGTTTIRVAAGGQDAAFVVTVLDADLEGIVDVLDDPFLVVLVGALPVPARTPVGDEIGLCRSAADAGHIANIESCIDSVRSNLASTQDGTTQALGASLQLLLGHVTRLLNDQGN